jgi:autophagy-related protein 5
VVFPLTSSVLLTRNFCIEPQVHFRGYPADVLSPCEGEDSVKWSYMNSLKEVCFEVTSVPLLSYHCKAIHCSCFLMQSTFIITGNSKSVMNMSQTDQVALWESVMKGMPSNNNISI